MINDTDIPMTKILRPTAEEFNDFEQFVEKLDQEQLFSNYGVIKVIPPAKWKARKSPYNHDFDHLSVHAPIEQNVQGKSGIYELLLIQKKSMKLNEYRKKVECFDHLTNDKKIEEVEEMFWKNIAFSPPLYGADMAGTLFDSETPWDLRNLPGVLKAGLKNPISGVNNPYLYVGSWKTMFGWHKEDLDLYSINYNHYGKPKFWYCIPLSESHKLENFARQYFIEGFSKCKEFVRHKTVLINPYLLKQKIPDLKIHKVAQYPGEFILTGGGAYHAGFNWGFNIAEAVNFASTRWLDIFPTVKSCQCISDSVKMNKADFYANILSHEKYAKVPHLKKICLENGAAQSKLHGGKPEQDDVNSVETTDSRDEEQAGQRGGRMSAFVMTEENQNRRQSTRIKTIKNTKTAQQEEESAEEQPIQRISSRSRKIKKLGEEFDTSDWRKGRMTQNGKTILASKKN